MKVDQQKPNRLFITIFSLMVFLLIAACSSGGVDDTGGDSTNTANVITPAAVGSDTFTVGQTVYNTHCASCHGIDGEGQFPDAPMQPDETGRIGAPPHDGTGHTWHHGDDLLIRYVIEGGLGDPDRFYPMPALGGVLSDEEITAVIAYIKTMWEPDQVAVQREQTIAARQQ